MFLFAFFHLVPNGIRVYLIDVNRREFLRKCFRKKSSVKFFYGVNLPQEGIYVPGGISFSNKYSYLYIFQD